MNIAQQIMAAKTETCHNSGRSFIVDYNEFSIECEDRAVKIEQDYDCETTTFVFMDGSGIVWSGDNVSAYGEE